jgi:polar amino acid transport system substrate-binding protein
LLKKSIRAVAIILPLLIELLFMHTVSAAKINTGESNNQCLLKYGWADWAPLQYIDASGELTGVQVDLVKSVSKAAGCDVKYIKLSWAQILKGLKSGEIDFTANATENEFRKSFSYFSIPYRRDIFSFWVRDEDRSRFDYQTVEKIMKSGMKLGLISDQLYSPEIELWRKHPVFSKNITYAEEIDDLILLLEQRKVESIVEDAYIIAFRKRLGGFSRNISHLSINTFGYPVAFMFSKKTTSKQLVEKYNQKMRDLKNTSIFQSIWLDPQLIQ